MSCVKFDILKGERPVFADQWSVENVFLKDTGRFSYEVTPFFREPTRAASDLINNCRVILKTPAQVGKTQTILNIMGWMSKYDPSNTMLILDSLKTGQRMSKNRLKPFLRDIGIAAFDSTKKDRSKETMNLSLGTGANLIIGSASSASDLCSTPVKYLFADELDRWCDQIVNEGDPLLLAFKRQLRFMGMAVLTSTPTTPEGRINSHYMIGTQEIWSAVCKCGCFMRVSYDDIDWSGDTPFYACPQCGEIYSETDIETLPHKYAKPMNSTPFIDKYGRVARSFEITATLCHNQYSWDALKHEEIQARSLGDAAVRSFRNTALGETYVPPRLESISVHALMSFNEGFTPQTLPQFVDRIVIGIDTQAAAFPYLIIGVSKDLSQVAFVHAGMILGDLHKHEPWNDLKRLLSTYKSKTIDGRELPICMAAIDSGGHFTHDIYALSMLNPRIRAIKGRSRRYDETEKTMIDRVVRVRVRALGSGIGFTDLTCINTRYCKDVIYTHLQGRAHSTAESLKWHWPLGFGIDQNFFEQLTSETRTVNSRGVVTYEKIRGRENHYLDCLVYALVAGEITRLICANLPIFESGDKCLDDPEELKIEAKETQEKAENVQPESLPKKKSSEKVVKPVKRLKKL